MEKTAPYFITGLFVTLTLFAFVGFLLWMQRPQEEKDIKMYTVEFSDSVSGLEEGSDVTYKGVRVGKVRKMHLSPESRNVVNVDIGVDRHAPVRAHTKIVLEPQGITGLVRMEMVTADDDNDMPEKRAGSKYPVLQGQGSQLYKALENIPVITAQTAEITRKINGALDAGAMDSMRAAFSGVEHVSREAGGAAESVRKLADKLNADPSQVLYRAPEQGVEIPR